MNTQIDEDRKREMKLYKLKLIEELKDIQDILKMGAFRSGGTKMVDALIERISRKISKINKL